MKFASAAKAEEVPHFSLVSSMGASPTSWIHYAKTKGQVYRSTLRHFLIV